jgi:hypothetical protein
MDAPRCLSSVDNKNGNDDETHDNRFGGSARAHQHGCVGTGRRFCRRQFGSRRIGRFRNDNRFLDEWCNNRKLGQQRDQQQRRKRCGGSEQQPEPIREQLDQHFTQRVDARPYRTRLRALA